MASGERFLMGPDGYVYGYNEWLAQEPGIKEVTEMEAYPERFVKGGKRKPLVNLSTAEIPEAPVGNPDIDVSASKGLPK